MAKKKKKHGGPGPLKVPREQMNLPVTFDAAGNMVTLRQLMTSGDRTGSLSFASLSPEQRAELTAKRIEAQPTFEMAMVGGGIISKTRAIEEVKAHTEVGRVLTEIEQRVILNLLEHATGR